VVQTWQMQLILNGVAIINSLSLSICLQSKKLKTMSYSQSQMSQNASNQIIQQMIRKENSYKTGIRENHDLGCTLAHRLTKGGQLETLLGENASDYREKLKQLSEKNVLHKRKVDAFMGALHKISNQGDVEDYPAMMQDSIEKELEQIHQSSVEVHQEKMYLDICHKLGEVSAANQDDELEVMEGASTVNLKCPITASLLQDPVKNKVCHHLYSKHAITDYLKRNRKCPCVGCGNNNVTMSQLEDDMATARMVRREEIRQQEAQRQISENAMDLEEDEDEDV
jgi:hypothetical protein